MQKPWHIRELAVEGRNNLADGLGGTGGGGDDVVRNGTATAPVLVRRTVDGALGGSRSVNGGHEALDDTKLVVDDLGEGRKAVGRAGRVRDDLVLRVVLVEVDADDEHRGVGGGRRDDDLLRAALQVQGRLLDGGEDTLRK